MKLKTLFSKKSVRISHIFSISSGILAAAMLTTSQSPAQTLEWAVSYNGISASALEETEGVVADGAGNGEGLDRAALRPQDPFFVVDQRDAVHAVRSHEVIRITVKHWRLLRSRLRTANASGCRR